MTPDEFIRRWPGSERIFDLLEAVDAVLAAPAYVGAGDELIAALGELSRAYDALTLPVIPPRRNEP